MLSSFLVTTLKLVRQTKRVVWELTNQSLVVMDSTVKRFVQQATPERHQTSTLSQASPTTVEVSAKAKASF